MGDVKLEHAEVERRADACGVGALRQGEAAFERSGGTLAAHPGVITDAHVELALAGDDQHAVVDRYVDVLWPHPRQLDADHEALVGPVGVDRRNQRAAGAPLRGPAQQLVDVLLEDRELTPRIPAQQRHGYHTVKP